MQALLAETDVPVPVGPAPVAPAPRANRHGAAMRLSAVREHGRIVDFRWEYANATAARLIKVQPLNLVGKALRSVAGPLGHPALIDRYRRVVETGKPQSFEQVHLFAGEQILVLHAVACSADGVIVALTNLSAQRQRFAPALEPPSLRAQTRAARPSPIPPWRPQ